MIFYRISFGPYCKKDFIDLEEMIDNYLAALVRNGQIGKDYSIVPWQKQVTAYVKAIGLEADQLKSHSAYGKELFREIEKFFKRQPVWSCNEDLPPKQKAIWKNASFLYLFAPPFNQPSTPLYRGDNNDGIPLYRVPVTDYERENIYFWQKYYLDYDNIWMETGKLELNAYRMLADPQSELSKQGRELCLAIEKATGIPTYYYLMRFFGRKINDEIQRKCPDCHNSWEVERAHPQTRFCHFYFQCPNCRLVSHLSSGTVNLRYAKIGE
ncbi:MAG: Zn-ribbon-containing protein [Planctomycetaceae bacterium]|jgi:predicted  nucleic acid-binding Zn ribbon protein|nr:Zn-ribbon-containing protein [Planctomycetaceae bacterium]